MSFKKTIKWIAITVVVWLIFGLVGPLVIAMIHRMEEDDVKKHFGY